MHAPIGGNSVDVDPLILVYAQLEPSQFRSNDWHSPKYLLALCRISMGMGNNMVSQIEHQ